jgi:tetratricopeptide (TPR) repeat protein
MADSFQKISHLLSQKGVRLSEYSFYLKHAPLFTSLTQALLKQNIDLSEYLGYLEAQTSSSLRSSVFSDSRHSSSRVFQEIEKIGNDLFHQGKVNLAEFNYFLKQIPKKSLSPRRLLQKLLTERKINAEEFLSLEHRLKSSLTEPKEEALSSKTFQLRVLEDYAEFYVEEEKNSIQTLGHYHLLSELGRGGMGAVYKAYHTQLNQIFALKVLLAGEGGGGTLQKRFLREAQMMAKLQHPAIVQIFDSGQSQERFYLVMEYVEGVSLSTWMKQRHSLREQLQIIKKVLEGLQYAHEQQIIHRDLKPDNILITLQNQPKIADFGLAKDQEQNRVSQKLTQSGTILGTAHYMSPEQAQGQIENLKPTSDLYSLGVCLYQILTKQLPHQAETLPQLLQKIIHTAPRLPSRWNKKIHPDLEGIVCKALEKQPEKRYQTAKAFAEDIQAFLEGSPLQAKALTPYKKASYWMKKHRQSVAFVLIVGVVLSFFLSLALWIKYQQHQEKKRKFSQALSQARLFWEQGKADGVSLQEKMQHLLQALNLLHQTQQFFALQRPVLRLKQQILSSLIPVTLRLKEYELATYLLQELPTLTRSQEEKKKQRIQGLTEQKHAKLQTHLKRLNDCFQELQEKILDSKTRFDFVLEISKMPENEILQKLLDALQEGSQYLLETEIHDPVKEQFYQTVVVALERLQHPKALPLLLEILYKFRDKYATIPDSKRPQKDMAYMVLIGNAIGNFKDPKSFIPFSDIYFAMGNMSMFCLQTTHRYRKLVRSFYSLPEEIQMQHIQNGKDAGFYVFKGYHLFLEGKFKEALEAYDKAVELHPHYNTYNHRGLFKADIHDYEGALLDYDKTIELRPNDSIGYNNRGLTRKELKDYQGALADYDQAIALEPENGGYYFNKSQIYYAQGDYPKAFEAIQEAVIRGPNQNSFYELRGLIYYYLKDTQKALDDFSTALSINPHSSEAYSNRSILRKEAGDLDGALADLNQVIRFEPKAANAYHNRASVKRLKNDLEGALLDYNETLRLRPDYYSTYLHRGDILKDLGRLDEALQDFEFSAKKGIHTGESYFRRSQVKEQQNDISGAIFEAQKAIESEPQKGKFYAHLGNLLLQQNQPLQALEEYHKAIELDPQNAQCYHNRAVLWNRLGKRSEAFQDINYSLKLDPEDADCYLNRAILYRESGDLPHALKDLDQSIHLRKTLPKPYYLRSQILSELGRYEEALRDCQSAREVKGDPEALYLQEAQIFSQLQNVTKAIECFEKALDLNPKNGEAYYNLGALLVEHQYPKEALEAFNFALEYLPQFAKAYNGKARAQIHLDQWQSALENFQKALDIDPHFLEVYYNRATLLYKKGRDTEARNDLLYFLKQSKNSNDPETQNIQRAVRKNFPRLFKNKD